jgi:hypothetical protein
LEFRLAFWGPERLRRGPHLACRFLAAIVVDQVVGWIVNWATDPVGKLEARVQGMLDEVTALVVEGDDGTEGLRAELTKLNEARSRVRAEALRRIVVGE